VHAGFGSRGRGIHRGQPRYGATTPCSPQNAGRRHEVIPVSSAHHPKHRHRPSPPDSVDEPSTPVVVGVDPAPPRRIPWADLLRLTFGLDLIRCPKCITGTVAVMAYITDPKVVLKRLRLLLGYARLREFRSTNRRDPVAITVTWSGTSIPRPNQHHLVGLV
jgi:hypothetical protein